MNEDQKRLRLRALVRLVVMAVAAWSACVWHTGRALMLRPAFEKLSFTPVTFVSFTAVFVVAGLGSQVPALLYKGAHAPEAVLQAWLSLSVYMGLLWWLLSRRVIILALAISASFDTLKIAHMIVFGYDDTVMHMVVALEAVLIVISAFKERAARVPQ